MKFSTLYFTLVLLVLSLHSSAQLPSFLEKESWMKEWKGEDEESPVDPGWWDQYYTMKKNAAGEIPRLPYDAIRQQELNATNREQVLFHIEEMGPGNIGGRTRAILIDADNSDHVFSGGVSGGLWVTSDSGVSWSPVNDFLSAIDVTCITQDHFNHDLIYIGTGEAMGNSSGVPGNGVYRSTDHGLSFFQLPATDSAAFDYIHRVVASPVDSGLAYIATNGDGLFRSFNTGDSITKIFDTQSPVNDLELTPSGGVWITVNSKGIYYSPSGDSGTFTNITSGLPSSPDFARIEMAQAPSDPSILYAAFEEPGGSYYSGIKGMFRSNDSGQTWQTLGNPDDDFHFYMSFPWYSMCMAVKPDDPDFVVFGVGDLTYTNDGGVTWKKCTGIHADHHAIVFNPNNPTRLYEGNDGGIHRFRTDQIWYTHTDLNNGYKTVQYYAGSFFPYGINAYAGAQDNGTHFCKNNDPGFTLIFGGDGAYTANHQQFPEVGYVSYQNGTIHRTDDASSPYPFFYNSMNNLDADNDFDIDEGAWFINPFEINLPNSDQLFFVTLKRVWQTIDGGYSWQPLMTPSIGPHPYAVGMSNEFSPTIYIGGEKAIFIRVDDTYNAAAGDEVGLTATVPSSVTEDFISNITVHPNDKSTCYVSFSNFSEQPRVWKVTDATSTPVWTPVSGDLPVGLPVNYIEVDPMRPDSFFLAATDYGLYISSDAGTHWVKDQTIPNVVVKQVKVRPGDRRVFLFTHGRGMWTGTLDSVLVGIETPSNNQLEVSVFPNPFAKELFLKTNENNVIATIRDANGRVVVKETISDSNASFNTDFLPAGFYFLEMNNGKDYVIRKIVKQD